MAGPVGHRELPGRASTPSQPPRRGRLLLDPAELAWCSDRSPREGGAAERGPVGAADQHVTDEQLAPSGLTNADVAYAAAPDPRRRGQRPVRRHRGRRRRPTGEQRDRSRRRDARGRHQEADEPPAINVSVGDTRVVGVDAMIRLGTDYLPSSPPRAPPKPLVPHDDATDLAPGTSGRSVTMRPWSSG